MVGILRHARHNYAYSTAKRRDSGQPRRKQAVLVELGEVVRREVVSSIDKVLGEDDDREDGGPVADDTW